MSERTINSKPDQTHAVVVGINHYGEGIPALTQQVGYAIQITQWLIDRQIPPQQIHLFLSPVPDQCSESGCIEGEECVNRCYLTKLGVNIKPAKENDIYEMVEELVRKSDDKIEKELFFLYWGGHGVVDNKGERGLLTLESQVKNHENRFRGIEVKSLSGFTKSAQETFSKQIMIIDSCASYSQNTGFRRFTFEPKKTSPQFSLFSAAQGQKAIEGRFSPWVLDWLKKSSKEAWPPDFEKLAREIKHHFTQYSNQTPVQITYQGYDGSVDEYFSKVNDLNLEELEEVNEKQRIKKVETANAYLLGKKFAGREKEQRELTDWLSGQAEIKMVCICDLGGSGKSALAWHWLHSDSTRNILLKLRMKQFWCTFYAKGYTTENFLKDLGSHVLGSEFAKDLELEKLKTRILEKLRHHAWLLVIDGLERTMGAFDDPNHCQMDSEEQDIRNEQGKVSFNELSFRSDKFTTFMRSLLQTNAKVLLTSRLLPEQLSETSIVRNMLLDPLSDEDAIQVWNLSGDEDQSPLLKDFFKAVNYHPQLISIVAAAVKESNGSFTDWFNEFPLEKKKKCLNLNCTKTERRHRWLELATANLIAKNKDEWFLLCYIVRQSEASHFEVVVRHLVKPNDEADSPGWFRSAAKLKEALDWLEERRLIGQDEKQGTIDVHPVVRGQISRYYLKQFVSPSDQSNAALVTYLNENDHQNAHLLRILDHPDAEERFKQILENWDNLAEQVGEKVEYSGLLTAFRLFYPNSYDASPWRNSLPALKARKDQAWCLMRTASELMTQGHWEDSTIAFRHARAAYHLCGDQKAVDECRQHFAWQELYTGELLNTEKQYLSRCLEEPNSQAPYWMTLLLSIRQCENTVLALERLNPQSRWELQTVAESYFYLDQYQSAYKLAEQAYDKREQEKWSFDQELWEIVTMGMALVRLGKFELAEKRLDDALDRGTGWMYNIISMFALAGLIECRYERALKVSNKKAKDELLTEADNLFKRYQKSDANHQYQIPAAEANLAIAKVRHAQGRKDDALQQAYNAIRIARGFSGNLPDGNGKFVYASALERAVAFLCSLGVTPTAPPGIAYDELQQHKKSCEWIKAAVPK